MLGKPVENPETVASAIRIGNPARWEDAMAAMSASTQPPSQATRPTALIYGSIGLVMALAASPAVAERLNLSTFHFVDRQALMLVPTAILMIATSFLSPRHVRRAGSRQQERRRELQAHVQRDP